jgi:hypothetical protein
MAKELTTPKHELVPNTYKALSVPAQPLTTFLIENIGSQGLRPSDLDKIKVRSKLKYLTVAPFRLFLEVSRLGYRLYRLGSLRLFRRA